MGKPRFRPASICVNPRDFGRSTHPLWVSETSLSQREIAWAVFQHRAALAVKQAMLNQRSDLTKLAKALGEDEAWLRRKLYGQAPADIGDVMAWALELGIDIVPELNSVEELSIARGKPKSVTAFF
jgi:hypothetical protein